MIRDYLRTLAVGSLALSILAVPAGDTVLKPKTGGSGVRCAWFNRQFNEWDFMLPGDMIAVKDGNGNLVYMVCGNDGKWHVMNNTNPGGGLHANPGGGGGNWAP